MLKEGLNITVNILYGQPLIIPGYSTQNLNPVIHHIVKPQAAHWSTQQFERSIQVDSQQ